MEWLSLISTFFYGMIFALGLIVPLGPQNLFVLSQGINNKSSKERLIVASCAALCDTLLIVLAIGGVSLLVFSFAWLKATILTTGVIFLVFLGWQSWKKNSKSVAAKSIVQPKAASLTHLISIILLLSLLNPYALIDTVVTIGSVSVGYEGIYKYIFALGCIFTSWCWFYFLIFIGRRIDRFAFIRQYEGKLSAIIMWLAAVYLVYIALS